MIPRPATTIAIVTFVVLVLELTSTRLFAYVGSSHATSTALSIAMLGLGIGAYVRSRVPRWAARVAPALAGSLFVVGAAATLGIGLSGLVLLSLAPFTIAGIAMSDAYAARGAAVARATYAIDLCAAASGCIVAPRLIGPLSPTEIVAVLGLVCCGWAWLVGHRRAAIALAVVHATVLVTGRAGVLPDGPLEVLLRSDRHSEKAIVEPGPSTRDVVDSAWSPLGRLDVVQMRDGRMGVFTDGLSPTYLVQEARARAGTFEDTWELLMTLPYRALRPDKVLVLGAGAGASVWIAKHYGASRIDAVEVNPAIPELLARWRHYAGDVYAQPGVRLAIEDARRYLIDTTERYDLIELALALTGNAQAQPSGMEAHLYTVEAVQLYLRRLTPNGALALIHSDPGNAYRQLLTVLAAIESRGMTRARALEHLVVLHDPRPGTAYRYLLVVGASPIPLDVVDRFELPAEILWGPGDPPERAAELLDRAKLGATSRDDFSPVHDDRPYFFQNTRGLVATAFARPDRLALLVGALLFVVVLAVQRGRAEQFETRRSFVRPAIVASLLGAAFLTAELALVQRFTLAAGGTLYAVSFVLFGLLAWSAAGALLLGDRYRQRARGVTVACVVTGLAVAATAVLVRDLGWLDGIAHDGARLLLVLALLAPVGLVMGGPFPTLLAHQGDPPARLASLWAINGAAAVAGGIAAVLALRVGGTTHALVLAAALYLVAAVVAPNTRSGSDPSR